MRNHNDAAGDMSVCSGAEVCVDVKMDRLDGYLKVTYFVPAAAG
jgi:hypothetical protein